MKILIDADACPVNRIVLELAQARGLPVVMVTDTSHLLSDTYAEIIIVDQGSDAADFALINRTEKGDIVITQDYGVATMALAKKAFVLNQNGLVYDDGNIDRLLFERHLSAKVRRSGGRTSGPGKRTRLDDESFRHTLENVIEKAIHTSRT